MTEEFGSSEAGKKGGRARAQKLTVEERREIAKKAAESRWAKAKGEPIQGEVVDHANLPVAKYRGFLDIMDLDVPCFVLDNGLRVIGRTSFTETLTEIKGGGGLEKYLGVKNLNPFIPMDLVLERFVSFRLPEVEGLETQVKGLTADLAIDICRGFILALEAADKEGSEYKLTDRQREMAIKASMFLAACAKVGLDALIDEATGYQYERAEDALRVKLRAYLEEEMRPWEKTFPDELWQQFARITNWEGSVTKRPKYWGKLVMEFIYDYLDPDVAKWLKENAPEPRHGRNYHQWLTAQYGLKKLIELIWKFIGVAGTCRSVQSTRRKWAEVNGKIAIQYTLFVDMED
jgi:hypothetical protein